MKSRSTAPWVQLHWKLRSGGVSAGASEIEVLQLAVQRAVRSASALFEGGVWKDPEKQREVEADAPSWKRSRETVEMIGQIGGKVVKEPGDSGDSPW